MTFVIPKTERDRIMENAKKRTIDDVMIEHGAPKKSAKIYEQAWTAFVTWMNQREVSSLQK